MEKITFRPLIDHLGKSGEHYNQLYHAHELRYGSLSRQLLTSWIVRVIEPVVIASATDELQAGKVFSCFYRSLLPLLGNQLAITYEREYQQAWSMLAKNAALMQESPAKIVNAVNNALVTLRIYQPGNVLRWISLMEQTIAQCKTVDDLLRCGRIYAWLCGMAQFRQRAMDDIVATAPELKTLMERASGTSLYDVIGRHWYLGDEPTFAGVAGGFKGLEGPFRLPPKVALVGKQIVATDDQNTCALFADSFGSILITDTPFVASEITRQASRQPFLEFQSRHGGRLVPFDDVTSAVMVMNTLVMTRESSFYLYIYGWHA
ncbi:hypothetical protein KK083_19275 [Fulvivirgaceae bacterium PWU4]|uniref:Uncharacterized protein n=1 Tax=Chryseosolibacter histidini TaxID=2782349 RepID=A0AAP2DMG0_9BACT|nr:hypothetical protein [Chryseosolibacter histidini]MBT1699045.1 hypothetical protein [Chryseosolibacter histidini]